MPSFEDHVRRYELLLLDTGPIRELVCFHAVQEFRFERLRPELRFITSSSSYRNCSRFIEPFRSRATCASVVVELHHWIRNTDPQGQVKLWNRVCDEFEKMRVEEELVRLPEMDRSLVARLGPADASLIALGLRHARRAPVLLTVEDPERPAGLHRECLAAGIDVCSLQEATSP
jgi:hypothetical protein